MDLSSHYGCCHFLLLWYFLGKKNLLLFFVDRDYTKRCSTLPRVFGSYQSSDSHLDQMQCSLICGRRLMFINNLLSSERLMCLLRSLDWLQHLDVMITFDVILSFFALKIFFPLTAINTKYLCSIEALLY